MNDKRAGDKDNYATVAAGGEGSTGSGVGAPDEVLDVPPYFRWVNRSIFAVVIIIILFLAFIIYSLFFGASDNPRTQIERDLQIAKAAVETAPWSAKAHFDLGEVYFRMGRNASAVDEFKEAAKLDKTSADPHYFLAGVYIEEGKEKEAITELKAAIENQPRFELAYYELANIYYKNKDYDEASKYYSAVLILNSGDADSHYRLGLTYEKLGQKDQAIESLKRALAFVPDYEEASAALERVEQMPDEDESAEEGPASE